MKKDSHSDESRSDEYEVENDMNDYVGCSNSSAESKEWEYFLNKSVCL